MKTISRNILLTLIACATLGSFTMAPRTAMAIPVAVIEEGAFAIPAFTMTSASWPTALTELGVLSGSQIADTAVDTANLGQKIMEWIETLFTETLRDALLGYLTDQVVAYISGNADGIYIGNWQEYLSGVVATEMQGFIEEVAGIDICSAFSAQLKIMISPPPVGSFSRKITCTFDEIAGNFNDFIADFKNGSWISYDSAWRPENNVYGIFLAGTIEMDARAQEAKENARAEGIAGAGFLGSKKCTNPNDPSTCVIETPGSIAGKAVSKAVVDTPFDRVVGANNLANFVSAVTNALIGRALKEGLGALQPSQDDPSDINNYVSQRSVERSVEQRYKSEVIRLRKNLASAINKREAAADHAANADTRWLKHTNGATNIVAEAARQISVAKQVLTYILGQLNNVTMSSQIKENAKSTNQQDTYTTLQRFCKPVRSVREIDDTAIPSIRNNLLRASEALMTFEIADDDFPEADPEFVVISQRAREINQSNGGTNSDFFVLLGASDLVSLGISESEIDPTEEDNLDQLAFLKEVEYQINNEMLENTEETRFRLGELQSIIGANLTSDAEAFERAMKKIDNDIEKVFRVASAYANRLNACFKPYNENNLAEGIVVAWERNDPGDETAGKPPRNPGFPWEAGSDSDPDASENTVE